MKKIYLLLTFILLFGLSACSSIHSQTISYGDKIFVLESRDHVYEQAAVTDIPDVYLWSSLQQVYLEVLTETWETANVDYFRDSLFFAQKDINSKTTLDHFVNNNINQVLTYYGIEQEDDRSQKSFVCKSKIIPSELLEFTSHVDEENSLYFAQYFYIHVWVANIISFVSDSKNERKLFVSSMNSFHCK